jgi:hypothetical protein
VPYVYSHAHGGRRFSLHKARVSIPIVKGERIATVEKALQVMRTNGQHYCRAGEIVKVTSSGDVLPRDRKKTDELLYDLDSLAQWVKFDGRSKTLKPCDCESNIAAGVLAAKGSWALPELIGIATAPVLDPVTGRIISQDGYDPESRLMLILDEFEKWQDIPGNPTEEQVREAVGILWRPFRDFPYVTDVDRGVMMALILTAMIRPLLPTAPAFGIDAPVASSGKTLVARSVSHIAGEGTPGTFPSTKEEDEIRKRLGALLRYARRVAVLDNIEADLQSSALCSLLTEQGVYYDRILGASELLTLPTRVLIILTGNNLSLRGDLCRRVLMLRIDPRLERPWERRFDLDPAEYCKEHRREMVAAALTVLKAGLLYGPEMPDRTGSFEVWSDSVRRSVLYLKNLNLDLKLDDPVKSITAALESDTNTSKLSALLEVLEAEFGNDRVTVAKIIKAAKEKVSKDSDEFVHPELRAAVEEIAIDKGVINSRQLGRWLEKNRGRIIGGRWLEKVEEKAHGGGRQWKVSVLKKVEKKDPPQNNTMPANDPQGEFDFDEIPEEGLAL